MPKHDKMQEGPVGRESPILTIPNILSLFRILLIPVFVYFFFADSIKNHYLLAVLTFALSGLSDVADGFIARHFGQISNFGKVLDPIADKLTQAATLVCLAFKHRIIISLVILLFTKEILMLIGALLLMGKGARPSEAKWWGKLSSVVLFVTMILFLLDSLYVFLPGFVKIGLVIVCGLSIIFSLLNYYPFYRETIQNAQTSDS